MTFIAVLLDRYLHITKRHHVSEVSSMTRVLICSLSDCYQVPWSARCQVAKRSLHAAGGAGRWPSRTSSEKHTRLQVLDEPLPEPHRGSGCCSTRCTCTATTCTASCCGRAS
ncbi:GL16487 [Drosophila persimilis]|uniref:GL16487 n=1 Tax=Drosophila persimilis TaxID=7234 RepID=B4GWA5_DROPE|nr:GL16487 [Drosophila persimilis]